MVLIAVAAANRDPDRFPDPGTIMPGRGPHLAFGHGKHYCSGAPLARPQGTVALRALFDRLPDIRLAVAESELRRHGLLVEHSYDAVPVFTGMCGHAPASR
ncbi:hypothetical protein CFP71_01675 [Amycolatopsis thailandensis]|uniref:Cytochrome P450 n=1 Tax=Amycolatopsis thailandensis TaxID=589330 RepID=A0A229SIQ0_9PSEU|nr:hypothetical protein CFP71_01675 [Amycolatopsis thailandensis]